ncbi:dihydropyrimidinase [Salicibibacter cibi]|uniref:Dihydropyrimidinase n=1 Tax=Salicibibacter cibi TaxID=2743001 RepID=A0A7T6Z9G0_9BACI|nr:dihydropyrimidinase [Salicibibacter cibi]QQK78866.1 dihydropyrimidinase [Salicibibacter cibi]
MKTIIKNGTIVTSSDTYKADVIIEEGAITGIVKNATASSEDKVIDVNEQYVFPGGIDVHAHLANSGTVDDFESGTKAAAIGGLTSIINFTMPNEDQSILDNLREWKSKAKPSYIDYGFHSIINQCNDSVLDQIPSLANEEGVTSIKLFMAYRGENMVSDLEMYRLMKKAGENGMIVNVHAENGDVVDELRMEAIAQGNTDPIYHAYTRPATQEAEATNRAIRIGEVANTPVYIVHVSCSDSLEQIIEAKKRGITVYGETCPHYLVLDETYLEQTDFEGAKYVCSPPLRKKEDQDSLWKGIATGNISTIGSDHSSLLFDDGKKGKEDFTLIPNGLPSIEDIFHITYHFGVHEGRISLQKFVDVVSTGPAKIFGMYPNKGTIAVGADADIVIFDPKQSRVISQKTQYQSTDYNIYEGMEVKGAIIRVLSRGEEIVRDNTFLGEPGRGKFIYRRKFSESSMNYSESD